MTRTNAATPDTVEHFAQIVLKAHAVKGGRYLLGLAGSPASGKSTFSAQLVASLNKTCGRENAIVVPMDGYHYSNEELDEKGLKPLKGIPATFDASGFVDLIRKLKSENSKSVFAPLFDRSIEASIHNGIEVRPDHEIIVSEGNYLLLNEHPWKELRELFDAIWFIDSTVDVLIPRLTARHKEGGRNDEETKIKMESTDLPNARLIESTKARADRVIQI
jgi:pantothenate kinase